MSDAAERLWKVIEPYLAAEHIELDDVEVLGTAGASILRVTVDTEDGAVGVEDIARISRGISRLLDESDPIQGSYTLEVSSPGLERKLRRPRHYEKSIGADVRVKTVAPIEGQRLYRGVLVAATGEDFSIEVAEGTRVTFPYDDVASARTVFVWEKMSKPGKRQ